MQQFDGDTGFPNPAAIKTIAGVPEEDIIDASFVNSIHIVPFYVALDNREGRKDLVIAVRGTFSIKVCIHIMKALIHSPLNLVVNVVTPLNKLCPGCTHRCFSFNGGSV